MPAATAVHHTVLNQDPLRLVAPIPYTIPQWNISCQLLVEFISVNGIPSIGVMRTIKAEIIKGGNHIGLQQTHTAWSHTFTCFIKADKFSLLHYHSF